ncbi:vacuolar protein sorting/targeting protein PEP1 [Polyrhizophydium stewartii]|uniref:Vacuolar protein sorting/targeting protein PEP1 n=1 Tax=Polyrhizophydium stewartii TaxID=2732419 RepID=A0ABR4MWV3_9FUNG|nr:vacuolar protein sorting/targeting protein PEP1 [Polyrhizophydium stewartii]
MLLRAAAALLAAAVAVAAGAAGPAAHGPDAALGARDAVEVPPTAAHAHLHARQTGSAPPSSAVGVSATKFEDTPSRLFYFANSETVLMQEAPPSGAVWRSTDEGKTWSKAKDIPADAAKSSILVDHPFAKDTTAILLTRGKTHYITTDRGASWSPFSFDVADEQSLIGSLSFHATKPSHILYRGRKCEGSGTSRACRQDTFYTTDSFKSSKLLLPWTESCIWAQNVDPKATGLENTVFCTEWPQSERKGDTVGKDTSKLQLVRSDKFFADGSKTSVASNVPILAVLSDWLLTVSKSPSSSGMHLSVSKDGFSFVTASFPTVASQGQQGYTVLESSNASLFVDVISLDPRTNMLPPYGSLFKSDSDGTYFVKTLDHTNRDLARGLVDFERIQSPIFDGVLLANVVANWRELSERVEMSKRLASVISFDNGGRWLPLAPPDKDMDGKAWSCTPSTSPGSKCSLHVHSVTSTRNIGKVFSTASAPGILVAVGSVGASLQPYEYCDTFMSDDAGHTWRMVMRGPAKFEILDMGSIVVLIPDAGRTDKILYSPNRGRTWETVPVKADGDGWLPLATVLDDASTSLRMILAVNSNGAGFGPSHMIQLDFSKVHGRKCDNNVPNSKDFELWKPRGADGQTECVLGQSTGYYRVKADAGCYVGEKFKLPRSESSPCACTPADFECDIGFDPDPNAPPPASPRDLVCVAVGPLRDQPLGCKPGDKYKGRSGYRKIPGNVCKGGDESRAAPVERTCETISKGPVPEPPEANRPIVKPWLLSDRLEQFLYIAGTPTILALTRDGKIWRSPDEGLTWAESVAASKIGKRVLRIALHESVPTRVFVLTDDDIYVSSTALDDKANNGAGDLELLKTPAKYNGFGIKILDFHPDERDWYVFVAGGRGCPNVADCFATTYITKDAGKTFAPVDTWSNKCLWARDFGFRDPSLANDAVVCTSFKYKNGKIGQDRLRVTGPNGRHTDNPSNLVLITDMGKTQHTLIDDDVIDFFVVDGIMVVAVAGTSASASPRLMVSTDGQKFVDAKFPPNVKLDNNGFVVLDSNTGGIFVDSIEGSHDYGTLFKSSEDGQFFSKSLPFTHRGGARNLVDFEKVQGIPGIILANVVGRPNTAQSGKAQTVMSYDDGSTWVSLTAPTLDSTGARMDCGAGALAGATADVPCRLHLHGISATKATPGIGIHHSTNGSAGLLVGVGNAGESLLDYNLGNVFLSRDAGRTWTEVLKDAHKWAIADYGGLIVMVNDERPVDSLWYSWDFGSSWASHKFSDRLVRIEDVATKPGADSRKVVITGHYVGKSAVSSAQSEYATAVISVDFGKLFDKKCDANADFETWFPGARPGSSEQRCFFGEEVSFRRRKADAVCFVGEGFNHVIADKKTCECSEVDFECDFNFFRGEAGTCNLYSVDPDQPRTCPLGTTYKGQSGYRRITLSRCKGGKDLTAKVERECRDPSAKPGKIKSVLHTFPSTLDDFLYFNRTSTVVAKTAANEVYRSTDNGQTWARVLDNAGPISAIVEDTTHSNRAFFVTAEAKFMYTGDNGAMFASMGLPAMPALSLVPDFFVPHPTQADWLLFIGAKDCDGDSTSCHTEVHVSFDFGRSWSRIATYAENCRWASAPGFASANERGVFCAVFDPASGNQRALRTMKLARIADASRGGDPALLFPTTGFAISNEYLISAMPEADSRRVQVQISLNGNDWSLAKFPENYLVHTGYTVLDSSSGAVFLDVIESIARDREHGTLMKSNWNGTFYKEILTGVNQNRLGFADFEKIAGVPGAMIANQIANLGDLARGDAKKIQTKMSFDDGATWSLLAAPKVDSNGKQYDCRTECNLHLHAYTERHDPRDQFSSPGSVGYMMGVGNVGSKLLDFNEGDTFLTRDGGRTWIEIAKEAHMFEFGDHGGVLLLVNDEGFTDTIKYSIDAGQTMNDVRLVDIVDGLSPGAKIRVSNILTDDSGTTSHFIVLGKLRDDSSSAVQSVSLYLEFSTLFPRKCNLDRKDPQASDYESWNPSSSLGCLFGTNTTHFRRKPDRECLIGQAFTDLASDVRPCDCQLADFECDAGYHSDGNQCLPDPDTIARGETCGKAGIQQGYRQRKISACVNADKVLPPSAHCPVGSISSGLSFWTVLLWLVVLGGVGWAFVHFINGGFTREGRVRLPLDREEPIVGSGRRGVADWGERIGRGVRTAGLLVLDGLVAIAVVGYRGFDWVRERLSRSRGYAPVRTTTASAPGRFSFDDAGALDLEWEDGPDDEDDVTADTAAMGGQSGVRGSAYAPVPGH